RGPGALRVRGAGGSIDGTGIAGIETCSPGSGQAAPTRKTRCPVVRGVARLAVRHRLVAAARRLSGAPRGPRRRLDGAGREPVSGFEDLPLVVAEGWRGEKS